MGRVQACGMEAVPYLIDQISQNSGVGARGRNFPWGVVTVGDGIDSPGPAGRTHESLWEKKKSFWKGRVDCPLRGPVTHSPSTITGIQHDVNE
jgi:hypothetical protein